MLIIEDKLISLDLLESRFSCAIEQCKGACCIAGDMGAPLEEEEIDVLNEVLDKLKPYLSPEGRSVLEEGVSRHYEDLDGPGTPLMKNGACAFVRIDQNGIAQCTIEEAYNNGDIDFKKPISCHLYPIRVKTNKERDFEALNYDRWDICHAACNKGKRENIKVYEFGKDALIRKFGQEFYHALEEADAHYQKSGKPVFE